MRRILDSFEDSSLRTFYSLESNLKRERRVFSMVIVLLICATISAAAVTIATRLSDVLRRDERTAQNYEQDIVDTVLQNRAALVTASLMLELHANGILPAQRTSGDKGCVAGMPAQSPHPELEEGCDTAVQLLSAAGQSPSIEMVLADGSASYRHGFTTRLPSPARQQPAEATRDLADAVLDRFRSRGIDPVVAARERRVVWLAVPAPAGKQSIQLVGASIVLNKQQIYAVVLTGMNFHDLLGQPAMDTLMAEPIIVDGDGHPLVPDSDVAQARMIDTKLQARQDGSLHWIPGFGWALRRSPVIPGFGHMLHLLPLQMLIHAMRYELLLILSVAAALIALLVATFRYWNYQFLTRTYAEASRALESEMLNHLLVHATPVGLCIVRRKNLEIMVANQIARSVLGLTSADTRLPEALCSEFSMQRGEDALLNRNSHIYQFPFSLEREPHDVHLEITYAPARLSHEEVFFCAIADMTEHHRAEQVLREAKLTTEAAAKAKVNFFASMSHEIRTPLSSLVGNIELVALGPLAPEQRERVRAMQVSAEGLLQVVNDVLDFSKIDIGELSLSEEWRSMTELLSRLAASYALLATRQGLKLYLNFDRTIPTRLHFDPVRVSQIINNLLSNAFKFTQSGKITLRARWTEPNLEISVIDSGIGIPDALRDRLFQPFTQGDSNRLAQARGTGLGLSICARLCELMNGHIALDSAVGVGTHITVTLPLRSADSPARRAELTLTAAHPVLLCRAPEYQEWLSNLFDPQISLPTSASDLHQPIVPSRHDFLLATDEFDAADVLAWWGEPHTIVWVRQAGPLVPSRRADGGIEVSVYYRPAIKAATLMIDSEPSCKPHPPAHKSARQAAPEGAFDSLTVLIAEDNLLNRSLLRDQLVTLGANVIEAANGDEALALLLNEPVDIVLTDIDMPILNGFQLLDETRRNGLRMPIYAVSASARPEDIANGRTRGFTDYLTKPVALAVLAQVLENALGRNGAMPPEALLDDETRPEFPEVPPQYTEVFIKQAERDLSQLTPIVNQKNAAQLRQWLHSVSGGLSMLGPSQLLEHCQELRAQIAETAQWNDDIENQCLAIAGALGSISGTLRARLAADGAHFGEPTDARP
ncbi:ATP-binding protein [Burkholderia thailandensis]|uniref:Virulence sensor protein BvgS n=1 Tax=Burkholderia thailandensis TaxID=57975 RepID=A0AAW9CXZ0_BURTH|nr:ATP-binding protein [Burkholderia thailandensis]MCS3392259.1 ATP-binding protein [Burkholderia thailandensis]MCS6427909.1 ATP-binding protein [Burkholderia thailandensis]MCS6453468.1 ATP-binding protein [Burkholderia thailandensis]MCS6467076.1 ATP-binding protein [Burkholderia thailandensis]MCS6485610.1 ATP-binding protein [Burkholderia thailandensis]